MITGKPTIIPFNKWMCTPNRWFILENIWKYYENWRLGGLGYPYFRKPPSVSEDLKTQTIPRSQPQRSSSEHIATSGWYFTLPDDNSSLRYSFSMVLAAIFVYRTVSTFFSHTLSPCPKNFHPATASAAEPTPWRLGRRGPWPPTSGGMSSAGLFHGKSC